MTAGVKADKNVPARGTFWIPLLVVWLCVGMVSANAAAVENETDSLSLIFENKTLPIEVEPVPGPDAFATGDPFQAREGARSQAGGENAAGPADALKKKPARAKAEAGPLHDPIDVIDKPLVLGGRGLGIRNFEYGPETDLRLDFRNHLKIPDPYRAAPRPKQALDLALAEIQSTKYLVFRPLRYALGTLPQVDPDKDKRVRPERTVPLEPVDETYLELFEPNQTEILLRPASRQMDVLIGNEKINRNEYRKW